MITIDAERLIIRSFRPDDWRGLHKMTVQFEASEYAPYDHTWPTSEEEVRDIARWFSEGNSFLAVTLKSTGDFIGFITLHEEDGGNPRAFGLGYRFDFDYHGKGYGTEGCRAVLAYAFDVLAAEVVHAGTGALNEPSVRLLHRLGFDKTGEAPTSFRKDEAGNPIEFTGWHFTLTKDAWFSAKRP
jgi:[ribosomal protein S5]-alanine N-acetyltransferase